MEILVNGENKETDQKAPRLKLRDYIPSIENVLDLNPREKRFLDFLRATPSKDWLHKSGYRRSQNQITHISSDPGSPDPATSTGGGSRRSRIPFVRKINWISLIAYCKNWVKHPMNIALLIWLFFVAACLVVLFLLMTGILNHTIRNSSVRKDWTEIFNQILNALFTIMCLYQHPRISHHLVLLWRFRPNDAVELRKIYCKKGRSKPHERAHMIFVVILLQITCFSQYGLCSLYWAFTSKTRPDWPQYLFIALGTIAPIIAGLYVVFSPLGRKSESANDGDEEMQWNHEAISEVNGLKSCDRRVAVTSPEWVGGLFDCCDDIAVYYLSFFCTFCVFGWNMERLGFGNMYVHIVTFMLLCSAPVIVFSIAALNINNDAIRYLVGITGFVLCLFGLLYGGFWRIQIRRRFKLPGKGFCFGFLALSDFVQWLFCWSCSLAQEVRTGNFYDVESEGFSLKGDGGGSEAVLIPLPRENGAGPVIMRSLSSEAGNHSATNQGVDAGPADDEIAKIEMMRPPVQTSMMKEEDEVQGKR